jgi:hypothetical protein
MSVDNVSFLGATALHPSKEEMKEALMTQGGINLEKVHELAMTMMHDKANSMINWASGGYANRSGMGCGWPRVAATAIALP